LFWIGLLSCAVRKLPKSRRTSHNLFMQIPPLMASDRRK
jgi:hypothetical protein